MHTQVLSALEALETSRHQEARAFTNMIKHGIMTWEDARLSAATEEVLEGTTVGSQA